MQSGKARKEKQNWITAADSNFDGIRRCLLSYGRSRERPRCDSCRTMIHSSARDDSPLAGNESSDGRHDDDMAVKKLGMSSGLIRIESGAVIDFCNGLIRARKGV